MTRMIEIDANSDSIMIGDETLVMKVKYPYELRQILEEIFNYLDIPNIEFTYVDEDNRSTIYEG